MRRIRGPGEPASQRLSISISSCIIFEFVAKMSATNRSMPWGRDIEKQDSRLTSGPRLRRDIVQQGSRGHSTDNPARVRIDQIVRPVGG